MNPAPDVCVWNAASRVTAVQEAGVLKLYALMHHTAVIFSQGQRSLVLRELWNLFAPGQLIPSAPKKHPIFGKKVADQAQRTRTENI